MCLCTISPGKSLDDIMAGQSAEWRTVLLGVLFGFSAPMPDDVSDDTVKTHWDENLDEIIAQELKKFSDRKFWLMESAKIRNIARNTYVIRGSLVSDPLGKVYLTTAELLSIIGIGDSDGNADDERYIDSMAALGSREGEDRLGWGKAARYTFEKPATLQMVENELAEHCRAVHQMARCIQYRLIRSESNLSAIDAENIITQAVEDVAYYGESVPSYDLARRIYNGLVQFTHTVRDAMKDGNAVRLAKRTKDCQILDGYTTTKDESEKVSKHILQLIESIINDVVPVSAQNSYHARCLASIVYSFRWSTQ